MASSSTAGKTSRENAFDLIDHALAAGGVEACFDALAQRFIKEKDYARLFEARLMRKRHELGLALVITEPLTDLPPKTQRAYDEGSIEAAREVGQLFLQEGQIGRAWPYFRAIGETQPVADAIDKLSAGEGIEPAIEIAYYERVNPPKGFELILEHFGTCRAITAFNQYPTIEGREESAALLVRTVHSELLRNLKRGVEQREGEAPETGSISELLLGRDWLFENNAYYLDTSHVASVVQFSKELKDPEALRLALELCEYGKQLAPVYQYPGEPPFEDIFGDHGVYLRALLGEKTDQAVAHFRRKLPAGDPHEVDTSPAQALVRLLVRLGRFGEAIQVHRTYLRGIEPMFLQCPTLIELCAMAGDRRLLREIALDQGDLLAFTAAAVES